MKQGCNQLKVSTTFQVLCAHDCGAEAVETKSECAGKVAVPWQKLVTLDSVLVDKVGGKVKNSQVNFKYPPTVEQGFISLW
uniref:Uncharacterized protein n=1 Tax=Physcomitrium patens TaxID=3218 RepID=A0A7I4D332_PHYPA